MHGHAVWLILLLSAQTLETNIGINTTESHTHHSTTRSPRRHKASKSRTLEATQVVTQVNEPPARRNGNRETDPGWDRNPFFPDHSWANRQQTTMATRQRQLEESQVEEENHQIRSPLLERNLARPGEIPWKPQPQPSRNGNNKRPVLPRDKRPNIILIITDDQDVELGSMNFMPRTSRILKDGGAHFANAFVTTPMCCPSRSSILTGMYVHNHHVFTNNDNCSSLHWQQTHETRTFATYLNNAGYRTGYFGKYLNEYNGTYIPPGWREWAGLIRNSRFYNYTVNVNGRKQKHGDDYHADYYPDLITNDSLSFLRQSKQYFSNKPVMMVLSYPAPHGPEDAAPQHQHMFSNVTTHRTLSWNFAPNPDKQWILRRTGKMEPIHIKFTDALHRKRLQTLQTVDEALDRIYSELKKLGELNNTYIIYTSDHGYHLGQFGLVKGKAMPFDFDIRVPFYVRGPNIPKGIRVPNIVLNLDLAPTILDIANVDIPEHMDGRSVLKLFSDGPGTDSRINHRDYFPKRRVWRDTFLVESAGRQNAGSERKKSQQPKKPWKVGLTEADPSAGTDVYLSKEQRLAHICKSPEYKSPCKPKQLWECVYDGHRWRMQKCRLKYVHQQKRIADNCVCPPPTIDLDDDLENAPDITTDGGDLIDDDIFEDDNADDTFDDEDDDDDGYTSDNEDDSFDQTDIDTDQGVLPLADSSHNPGTRKVKPRRRNNDYLSDRGKDYNNRRLKKPWKKRFGFNEKRRHRLADLHDGSRPQSEPPRHHRGRRSRMFDVGSVYGLMDVLQLKYEYPDLEVIDDATITQQDNLENNLFANTHHISARSVKYPMNIPVGCSITPNNLINCSEDVYQDPVAWRQNKAYIDNQIKELKEKLGTLKDIRKHLKQSRPTNDNLAILPTTEECVCDNSSFYKRRQVKEERLRRKQQDQQRKIERQSRRKEKYQNYTCNIEKMNCFVHDNTHWKTPPFWHGLYKAIGTNLPFR